MLMSRCFGAAIALAGVGTLLVLAAAAVQVGSHSADRTAEQQLAAPGAGGSRAYIDPRTGSLTAQPPPGVEPLELSPAEIDMLSTSSADLAVKRSAGGARSVDLRGRFRHLAVATLGKDGKLEQHCIGGNE